LSVNLFLRSPTNEDWPAILRAADASLPRRAGDNREWLQNRMNFDAARFRRTHYVAGLGDDGLVLGYAAAEEGPTVGRFRVFVVMEAELLGTLGEAAFGHVLQDLRKCHATSLWAREEAQDASLIDFFERHGLVRAEPFQTPQGLAIVTLERKLDASAV
jgi:hypothetical protein